MLLSMKVTEPTAWFEGPPEVRFKPTLQFLIVIDLYVQPTCFQYMTIRQTIGVSLQQLVDLSGGGKRI